MLNYSFENLKYGDLFSGIRNNLNINSDKNRNLKLSSKNSFMQSDQNDYSSDFINSNNYVQLDHKIGWIEINYNHERKKSKGIQGLANPDFGQETYQFKNGFGNKDESFIEIGYLEKR
ncbi:MAG: hypothetical protein ACJ0O7_00120 [Flavobacteriaceae bacterium]